MSNRLRKHAKRHEDGGLDEIDLANLAGTLGDAQATQFYLLDGSRPPTGDIDMATNAKKIVLGDGAGEGIACDDTDLGIKFHTDGTVRVVGKSLANSPYKAFNVGTMKCQSFMFLDAISTIRAAPGYGRRVDIEVSGAAWVAVAQIIGESAIGVGDQGFDLIKGCVSGAPTSDPADGLSKIWVAVGGGPLGEDMLCRGT